MLACDATGNERRASCERESGGSGGRKGTKERGLELEADESNAINEPSFLIEYGYRTPQRLHFPGSNSKIKKLVKKLKKKKTNLILQINIFLNTKNIGIFFKKNFLYYSFH